MLPMDVLAAGDVTQMPGWMSLLPPIIAIVFALVFREVITALTLGILSGLFLSSIYSDEPLWQSMIGMADLIKDSAIDSGHMSIILFSLFVGGIVQLISSNGGMMAIVKWVAARAKDARSGQLATWFLGLFIFFDDYANTLVVGNTMRPLTDRLRISREKLAYIVDSTAAPVAATAFVTTWIGAELEYIQKGIDQIARADELGLNAYGLFVESLKYSFYPFLTLIFILFLILKRKDYGPMLKSEEIARREGVVSAESEDVVRDIDEVPEEKERAFNALIPIILLVVGTLAGLIYTGSKGLEMGDMGFFRYLSEVIGRSDSYQALLWASFGTLVITIGLTVIQRIMSLEKAVEHAFTGFKHMLQAIGILLLAWGLGTVTENLNTAGYVAELISDSVSPFLLPTMTFLLAGAIAFSTGSSWGTMAILYPVVLFTSWEVSVMSELSDTQSISILANCISSVLAGSVLGDHCSPISDTTILSSMASQCNHIQHVRTQMPYALTVGAVSVVLGTTLSAFGVPWYVCLILGALSLLGIVSYFGKMPETVK